jgi:YHS domain-containing protein
MIRFFVLRIIVPLCLILIVRSLIMAVVKAFGRSVNLPSAQQQARQTGESRSGGELKKDPVCGTYVSQAAAVTKTINGELIHFCSVACRDKYRVA